MGCFASSPIKDSLDDLHTLQPEGVSPDSLDTWERLIKLTSTNVKCLAPEFAPLELPDGGWSMKEKTDKSFNRIQGFVDSQDRL